MGRMGSTCKGNDKAKYCVRNNQRGLASGRGILFSCALKMHRAWNVHGDGDHNRGSNKEKH